jgi:hypothetical protein
MLKELFYRIVAGSRTHHHHTTTTTTTTTSSSKNSAQQQQHKSTTAAAEQQSVSSFPVFHKNKKMRKIYIKPTQTTATFLKLLP